MWHSGTDPAGVCGGDGVPRGFPPYQRKATSQTAGGHVRATTPHGEICALTSFRL